MSAPPQGTVVRGFFWMLLISILLFWLPVFGPLIAGIVGGKKAGSPSNGMLAALLPAIVAGLGLFILATFGSGLPVLGALAGMAMFMVVAGNFFGLIVGGLIGGALATR